MWLIRFYKYRLKGVTDVKGGTQRVKLVRCEIVILYEAEDRRRRKGTPDDSRSVSAET